MPLGETLPVFIEDEMKRSYLDYAMSVIVSRALPDVRDGLKPVHRRILFSMKENDNTYDRGYRKSARIVGDCFVAGTEVATPTGFSKIENLKVGSTVLLRNGEQTITKIYEYPKKPLITIKWKSGNLTTTKNQEFRAVRNAQLVWLKATDIQKNEALLTADLTRGLHRCSEQERALAYLAGHYAGNGWTDINKNSNKISFCSPNVESINAVINFLSLIDIKAKKYKRNIWCITLSSAQSDILRDKWGVKLIIGKHTAEWKTIPERMWRTGGESILYVLAGLIDTDGHSAAARNRFGYVTTSIILDAQINLMLTLLGRSTYRSTSEKTDCLPSYITELFGEDAIEVLKALPLKNTDRFCREEKRLPHSNTAVPGLYEKLKGVIDTQKAGLGPALQGKYKHTKTGEIIKISIRYLKSGLLYKPTPKMGITALRETNLIAFLQVIGYEKFANDLAQIVDMQIINVQEVCPAPAQKTYDIQVEKEHAFFANGILVHNCMGKYHPHGDLAIYEAMVRLAQPFSMRMPLVQGQGNFGSMDGDPAAASRYTEARLAKLANTLLDDLEYQTVDYQPNYDETENEPKVLPAGYPNLLVNGAQGIAVGMATNIPTHNLGEVINACCAYIDDNNITIDGLMQHVPAPDFPTGGIILGRTGSQNAYRSGKGAIVLRAKHIVEERERGRQSIVFTEIPYQINKAKLVERIAECTHKKVSTEKDATTLVQGIAEIRDESDRDGLRIVLDLKRDAEPAVVLNQLYHHTPLHINFNANMLALHDGKPQLLTLLDIIRSFVNFRHEVVARRTSYLLKQARDRVHVLIGLLVAINNLDAIVKLIRSSKNAATARAALLNRDWTFTDIKLLVSVGDDNAANYKLSEIQARAILDLRLARLTGLEQDKLNSEVAGLVDDIASYLEILTKPTRLTEVVRAELVEVKKTFDTPRKSIIEDDEFEGEEEDLIPNEDQVIMISNNGYIKRVPVDAYRSQRRGGKGRSSINLADEDFVREVITATTHTPILFFTSLGKAYQLKCHRLPVGSPTTRGRNLVNMLSLGEGEKVTTIMPMPEDKDAWDDYTIFFATKKGNVRRNKLTDFADVRANGKIAMKFENDDADDELVNVVYCTDDTDILLSTAFGKAVRFPATTARLFMGRASTGQRGITLERRDKVISMAVLPHDDVEPDIRLAFLSLRRERLEIPKNEPQLTPEAVAALTERERFVLTVTEKGFGVRCSIYDYRTTARGGPGLDNMDMSKRKDRVVAAFPVAPNDEIMLVTNAGQAIRCPLDEIRIARRRTQGVTIIDIKSGEKVVSVAKLESEE